MREGSRTRAGGREFNHGQGVNLADAFTFGLDQNLFQQNFILHTVSKIAFAPLTLRQHLRELFASKRTSTADHTHFTQLLAYPEWTERQGFWSPV